MKTRLPSRKNSPVMRAVLRGAIVLAAGAMLMSPVSCASKPKMEVHSAQVTGVGPLGISLNVVVKVYNPNSFDIQVRKVYAETLLAGRYNMPAATVYPNVWLPAKETTYVPTPVVVPWTLVPGVLSATLGNEKVTYHVKGYADVTATRALGVDVNHQQINEQGTVPREVMLRAARTSIPGAR